MLIILSIRSSESMCSTYAEYAHDKYDTDIRGRFQIHNVLPVLLTTGRIVTGNIHVPRAQIVSSPQMHYCIKCSRYNNKDLTKRLRVSVGGRLTVRLNLPRGEHVRRCIRGRGERIAGKRSVKLTWPGPSSLRARETAYYDNINFAVLAGCGNTQRERERVIENER